MIRTVRSRRGASAPDIPNLEEETKDSLRAALDSVDSLAYFLKNEHELLNTVFSALGETSDVTRQYPYDDSSYDNRMSIMEKQESRIKSVKSRIDKYETKIKESFDKAKEEIIKIEELITNTKITLNEHRVTPSLQERSRKVATDTVAADGVDVESLPVAVQSVFNQTVGGRKKLRRTRKNNKTNRKN
jgi:hypothetical protein